MDINVLISKINFGSSLPINTNGIFYYLYMNTNLNNGKIYVGARVFRGNDPNKDKYIGCGMRLNKSGDIRYSFKNETSPFFVEVMKNGWNHFKKDILLYFNSYSDLLLAEKLIVDDEFVLSDETYNKVIGGNCPPIGFGEKNNNWGHYWTNEMKEALSRKKIDSKKSAGSNNPRAKKCYLYDLLLDKKYELSFLREANEIAGVKLNICFDSVIKYRYFLSFEDVDPYEKLKQLNKSLETLKILRYIKDGISKDECKLISGIDKNFINRAYKAIYGENSKH